MAYNWRGVFRRSRAVLNVHNVNIISIVALKMYFCSACVQFHSIHSTSRIIPLTGTGLVSCHSTWGGSFWLLLYCLYYPQVWILLRQPLYWGILITSPTRSHTVSSRPWKTFDKRSLNHFLFFNVCTKEILQPQVIWNFWRRYAQQLSRSHNFSIFLCYYVVCIICFPQMIQNLRIWRQ